MSLHTYNDGSRTWGKKKCGWLPLEKRIGPRSATKPGRQKIPTIGLAVPGRRRPATVAPLPARPRTASLRLALCPSLRVPSFSFVLQRAQLPAFHSHFLTAHNTQFHRSVSGSSLLTCLHSIAIFSLHTIQVHRSASCSNMITCLHSIAIFSLHTIQALCFSHFLLSFSLHTNTGTVFLKFFFESHFFLSFSPWNLLKSQVSWPRWWWVQALPLSIVPHTAPPAPHKSKKLERWFYSIVDGFVWGDDSTALLMDLFEEKILANSMNSLTQQQWQELLRQDLPNMSHGTIYVCLSCWDFPNPCKASCRSLGIIGNSLMNKASPNWFHNVLTYIIWGCCMSMLFFIYPWVYIYIYI
jgi:hypothetical protein